MTGSDHDKKIKMENLDKRIQDARAHSKSIESNLSQDPEEATPEAKRSARAGSEFLANIIAGAFIGFGIDWYFATKPWAMILFILLGFISGVYRANEAMKQNAEKNDK